MVDQDGDVECRLGGWRRLNAQRDGAATGGAANQIARRPAGHFQIDRCVEPDLCAAVLQRAANQHGAAATALHRQIGERQRAAVSQHIRVGQPGATVNVADCERNAQRPAAVEIGERHREA